MLFWIGVAGNSVKLAHYITPAFSGIPNKWDKIKAKKKNKNRNFPMVSLILPTVLQTDPTGV